MQTYYNDIEKTILQLINIAIYEKISFKNYSISNEQQYLILI